MQAQRVSELTPEPISWLWQYRLALGKFVMLNRKVQASGGWLGLCGLTPDVRHVLAALVPQPGPEPEPGLGPGPGPDRARPAARP